MKSKRATRGWQPRVLSRWHFVVLLSPVISGNTVYWTLVGRSKARLQPQIPGCHRAHWHCPRGSCPTGYKHGSGSISLSVRQWIQLFSSQVLLLPLGRYSLSMGSCGVEHSLFFSKASFSGMWQYGARNANSQEGTKAAMARESWCIARYKKGRWAEEGWKRFLGFSLPVRLLGATV